MKRFKIFLILLIMGSCSNQFSLSEFYEQVKEYQYCDDNEDCAVFCHVSSYFAYNKAEYDNVQNLYDRIDRDYGELDVEVTRGIFKASCNEEANLCEYETLCTYSECDAVTDYDKSSEQYCCTAYDCPE